MRFVRRIEVPQEELYKSVEVSRGKGFHHIAEVFNIRKKRRWYDATEMRLVRRNKVPISIQAIIVFLDT